MKKVEYLDFIFVVAAINAPFGCSFAREPVSQLRMTEAAGSRSRGRISIDI